jgi:2-hydroxychromene-2-carboxylate isomerase
VSDIDLYFDFVSPYAYLAATRIDAIAARHRRQVRWHPFRLGISVVKVMGLRPLMETPLKSDYVRSDVVRLARVFDVPLARERPLDDPIPAARLFYGAPESAAPTLAKSLLHACWAENQDIADEQILVGIGRTCGIGEMTLRRALAEPDTRQLLNERTRAALARGVFGSPTFAVGGELFWGVDRLWLLEHYLASESGYVPLRN